MMKKTILAVFAVLAVSQSAMAAWSAGGYVQKVQVLEGCGANAGKTAMVVTTSAGAFSISSSKATFETTKSAIQNAIGSRSMVRFATNQNYNFQYLNSSASCVYAVNADILGIEQTTGQ